MARPTTALIVDDEAHARVFVRVLLRELGIEQVWEASDGGQAIEMLQQHEPELVLLDVNLPVMSGLDVLRELHQAQWDTPVVVLTSENALKTAQEAARLGACGYILKHRPRAEALEALRALLDELERGDGSAAVGGGAPRS